MKLTAFKTAPAAEEGYTTVCGQIRKPRTTNCFALVPLPQFGEGINARVLTRVYLVMASKAIAAQIPLTCVVPQEVEIPDDPAELLREFVENSSANFDEDELIAAIKSSNLWGSTTPRFQESILKFAPAIAAKFHKDLLPVNDTFCTVLLKQIDFRDEGEDWVEFVRARLARHFETRKKQEADAESLI